jgi:hypothetical protein
MGFRLSQFMRANFVLVIGIGLVVAVLSLTFLGRPVPSSPAATTSSLTPQVIASAVVSAFEAKDARAPEPPYPEFLRLPNMPQVQLLSSFLSFVEINDGGKIHRLKGVFVISGEIKQAYVLVHVARPLKDWEDVYVTINEKGGGLRIAESLRVPPNPRFTTLLYDARNVPYGTKEAPSDWFAMLKPDNRIVVDAFLNGEQASLLDVSLFYECVEPGTCGVTKK